MGPTRWTDTSATDPSWAPPSMSFTSRWRTPWAVTALVLVVVCALVGALWAVGGFDDRDDHNIASDVGSTVVCGPYEFSFTRATAQRQTDYSGKVKWEVVVIGTVANTADDAMSPPYDGQYGMFVARDLKSEEVQIPTYATIGAGDDNQSTVTPALPPTAYRVEFDFSQGYAPQSTLDFHAAQLEYRNVSLLSDEDEWVNGDRFYQFTLPLEILPPKDDS